MGIALWCSFFKERADVFGDVQPRRKIVISRIKNICSFDSGCPGDTRSQENHRTMEVDDTVIATEVVHSGPKNPKSLEIACTNQTKRGAYRSGIFNNKDHLAVLVSPFVCKIITNARQIINQDHSFPLKKNFALYRQIAGDVHHFPGVLRKRTNSFLDSALPKERDGKILVVDVY